MSYAIPTYAPLDVAFTHGEGCWLFDNNNKRYLDALGGVAVTSLGHNHANITKTISQQAAKLLHTSNWYQIPQQQELAEKLCQLSGLNKAFFANSGAEANETAIKLTRLYAQQKDIKNPIIITANASFHGRTMATLSASANEKIQQGFSPLVDSFIYADFNDIAALEKHSDNADVVAIMLEPIQGEAGIIIPDNDYLKQVRKLCDDNGWLLILDEIQTGMGRTGKWFAHQHSTIKPDIMTLAKALANGIPISACLTTANAAQLFSAGSHGSTFGGNPFACAVALSVIATIENDNLLNNAQRMGNYLYDKLTSQIAPLAIVKEIRGKGLMIGIELFEPCQPLLKAALDAGLLINIACDKNIRLLPALILNEEQADQLVNILFELLKNR